MKKILILLLSLPFFLGANDTPRLPLSVLSKAKTASQPANKPVKRDNAQETVSKAWIVAAWVVSVVGCSAFCSWIAYLNGISDAKAAMPKEVKPASKESAETLEMLQKRHAQDADKIKILLQEQLQKKKRQEELENVLQQTDLVSKATSLLAKSDNISDTDLAQSANLIQQVKNLQNKLPKKK